MRRCDFTKSIHSASQQSVPSCAHTDSKQATIFEVVLDDDVSDGVEDELNVVGVGGAREVCVHFLRILLLVQLFKLVSNKRGRVFVSLWPCNKTNWYTPTENISSS